MATGQVGAKKSLFKKPAWASTSAGNTDENAPIFGQAHLYQEIVQAQKERRDKYANKQKERAEKEVERVEERGPKRRRISKEAEDSDEGSDSDARSGKSTSVDSQSSHKWEVYSPGKTTKESINTPQKTRTRLVDRLDTSNIPQTRSQKPQSSTQNLPIVLDDDEHEDPMQSEPRQGKISAPAARSGLHPSRKKPRQPVSEPESSEEDEYLRELKAKARREALSKNLEPVADEESTREPSATPDLTSPSKRTTSPKNRATSNPTAEEEAVVKIWIKTIIPNAKEVIVNRKIGQPLDKVKDFWMKRNELDPALASKVFFTWNGTRLYNSTTMRGIIERLKKTHPTRDGGDPSDGHVVIEAVTDEIFEHRQKQRATITAARLTADDDIDTSIDPSFSDYSNNMTDVGKEAINTTNNDIVAAATAPLASVPAPVPGIVLKLKAQGLEEMSLRVRPHTTVRKILAGFRTVRLSDRPAVGNCWLSYDGDRLDEDATVEEVGFEHEDVVEVYLRQ